MSEQPMDPADRRLYRLVRANALIVTIASCGRHFLAHDLRPGHLFIDVRGRIRYRDPRTGKDIDTHRTGDWRGFSEGGTMQALIIALRDFVRGGVLLEHQLGPWPSWICDGDLWGYGEDMAHVRSAAIALRVLRRASAPTPAQVTIEPLYYVQDARQVIGNCLSWWRPEGKGYTCEIERAGKFTADQLRRMRRGIDVPWPAEYVDAHAIRHFRADVVGIERPPGTPDAGMDEGEA